MSERNLMDMFKGGKYRPETGGKNNTQEKITENELNSTPEQRVARLLAYYTNQGRVDSQAMNLFEGVNTDRKAAGQQPYEDMQEFLKENEKKSRAASA